MNEYKLPHPLIASIPIVVLIALLGVFTGLNFCFNFVLFGKQLETSVLMNDAVGYHVMAGITCLLIMMLSTLDRGEGKEENQGEEGDSEC